MRNTSRPVSVTTNEPASVRSRRLACSASIPHSAATGYGPIIVPGNRPSSRTVSACSGRRLR